MELRVHGFKNKAEVGNSIAIGNENEAKAIQGIAIGHRNMVEKDYGTALGNENEVKAEKGVAVGYQNEAAGHSSSAFGVENRVSGASSTVIGHSYEVSGKYSGAFGLGETSGANTTLTYNYKNAGENSYSIGNKNNIAAGTNNNFILGNEVAIGTGINNVVVLGKGSKVTESDTVSVGSETGKRRIVYVAAGTADTDAVNVGQLNTRAKNDASNLSVSDVTAWKTKLGVASIDAYTKAESDKKLGAKADKSDVYTKVDTDNKFLDKSAYNIDKATFATKTDINTKVNKDGSNLSASDVANWKTKLGVGSGGGAVVDAYTKAETDTKLGAKADKSDVYTKVDTDNKFLDKNVYNTDKVNFATKTELNNKANKADVYTKTESDNKLASKANISDVYSKTQADNKFAAKTDLDTRAQKDGSNLSASDIAIWKTKLATGSVSSIANTATGTGSTGLGHGNIVTGNYSTAVGYKNNVSGNNSGAFGDPNIISGNRSYAVGNDNNIAGDDNFVVGSNVTIAKDVNNSVALGNNSTVSNSNEVSVGSAGKERKITNVKDGDLSETSTDAVNGRQLFKVVNSISAGNTDALRKELIRENEKVRNEVRQVGSLSAALSALHPLQYDKNKPNQIMAGFGQYRDKSAVAVGMAHYFTENLMMTGGVSLSEGSNTKAMANVGLTWKFGKGGSQETMNTNNMYSIQEEVRRLTVENKKYMTKVGEQEKKIISQQSEIETLKIEQKKMQQQIEMLLKTKK